MTDFGSSRYGSARTAPFYAIIGPPPDCTPGDTASALDYWRKIQHALDTGSWHPTHANRLRELRRLWAFRASGQDLRFNLVGTKDGRLPAEVERVIADTRKSRLKALKKKLQPQDTRRLPYHEWHSTTWPAGKARGTPPPEYTLWGLSPESERALIKHLSEAAAINGGLYSGDWPPTRAKGYGGDEQSGAGLDGTSEAEEPEAGEPWRPNAREYIVPGQDSNGHSHRVWSRVQPAHHRAMCALKECGIFGFRTIGDLVRWCIVHGIQELTGRAKLPKVRSAMSQAEAISKILVDQAYYQDYARVFDTMSEVINKHVARNENGMAARLVGQIKQQIEAMQEPFWRDLWMGELQQRFGRFLTLDGAAILDATTEEDA